MGETRIEQTDRFEVENEHGERQIFVEFTELMRTASMADPGSWTEGLKSMQTQGGKTVNVLDEDVGTYRVFDRPDVWRRVRG